MKSCLDYELIDFGEGRKLERFGKVITDRPEILAEGKRRLNPSEWRNLANAVYLESNKTTGQWQIEKAIPDTWPCRFLYKDVKWTATLKTAQFKHVGIFPEQETQWKFLIDHCRSGMRVLNLFAYTGAASLSAAKTGADVFHVDSSKSVIKSAAANARKSDLNSIHWVVDDALKFARREAKRERQYDMIIMDPPIFGRGRQGQNRKLADQLQDLIDVAYELLNPNGISILNTYSPSLSSEQMVKACEKSGFRHNVKGHLTVSDGYGRDLSLSRFVRMKK